MSTSGDERAMSLRKEVLVSKKEGRLRRQRNSNGLRRLSPPFVKCHKTDFWYALSRRIDFRSMLAVVRSTLDISQVPPRSIKFLSLLVLDEHLCSMRHFLCYVAQTCISRSNVNLIASKAELPDPPKLLIVYARYALPNTTPS